MKRKAISKRQKKSKKLIIKKLIYPTILLFSSGSTQTDYLPVIKF